MKQIETNIEKAESIFRKSLKEMDITTLNAFMMAFTLNSFLRNIIEKNDLSNIFLDKAMDELNKNALEQVLTTFDFMRDFSKIYFKEVNNLEEKESE